MFKASSRPTANTESTPSISRKADREDRRNEEQALAFEQAMFDWRSRHLILVMTLGYEEEWRPYITYEAMCQHRNRFFANRRSNRLLRGINGYVWKVEEGETSARAGSGILDRAISARLPPERARIGA